MLKKMGFGLFLCFIIGNCTENKQSPTNPDINKTLKVKTTPVPSGSAVTKNGAVKSVQPSLKPTPVRPTATQTPNNHPSPVVSTTPTPKPTAKVTAVPIPTPTVSPSSTVTFEKVFPIIKNRCFACHTATTRFGGIVLETEAQIRDKIGRIKITVVDTKAMPQGNLTNMTQEERDLIGQWISNGAK